MDNRFTAQKECKDFENYHFELYDQDKEWPYNTTDQIHLKIYNENLLEYQFEVQNE
jgi:hypothetical protein